MNDELLKALANANFTLDEIEEEFRLYYDDNGDPIRYTPEKLEGNYIVVDKETWTLGRYDIKVIDGKIKHPTKYSYQKLVPSSQGVSCYKDDVSIIQDNDRNWSIKNYE